jgi:hypothetical protein
VKEQAQKETAAPSQQLVLEGPGMPLEEALAVSSATSKHRFSDVHNKIFERLSSSFLPNSRMDSLSTHYAALREHSESPAGKSPSLIRVPKRPISVVDSPESSPKCAKTALAVTDRTRYFEGRREESLSEHGRDIQNIARHEFQKRLQMQPGLQSESDEDSIEFESRTMGGKTGLEETGDKLTLGKQLRKAANSQGKVILVKAGNLISAGSDDSPFYSGTRDFSIAIKPPALSVTQPSIILVPGAELALPDDKKIPSKHTPKSSKIGSKALVIPAAGILTRKRPVTRSISSCSGTISASPRKVFPNTTRSTTFTMGSIPDPKPVPRGMAQRGLGTSLSPRKPRITRTATAVRATAAKPYTIRHATSRSVDVQVPVNFNGAGKRKHRERDDSSPSKRIRINTQVSHNTYFVLR